MVDKWLVLMYSYYMSTTTLDKNFATTIGAEAFARDKYEGEFPLAVTVTSLHPRKGLIKRTYTMPRKPTMDDLLPVGTLSK